MTRQSFDGDDFTMRYQQVYQGVPVIAGEMIVNADARGLRSMSGEVSPNLSLDVRPTISAEAAIQTALGTIAKVQKVDAAALIATDPELWIYDEQLLLPSTRPVELVWRMNVSSIVGAPINELVLVNAHSGGLACTLIKLILCGQSWARKMRILQWTRHQL